MIKKILALLMVLLVFGGCAKPSVKTEDIPPSPSQGAIWVYGHYDPQGIWVPGRWIE